MLRNGKVKRPFRMVRGCTRGSIRALETSCGRYSKRMEVQESKTGVLACKSDDEV